MKAHLIKAISCIFLTACLLFSHADLYARHYYFTLRAREKNPYLQNVTAQEVEGYWKLVETWVYEYEHPKGATGQRTYSTGNAGEVTIHCVNDSERWPGFRASIATRWEDPPEIIIPGNEYSIPFSSAVVQYQPETGRVPKYSFNTSITVRTKMSSYPFSLLKEGKGITPREYFERQFNPDFTGLWHGVRLGSEHGRTKWCAASIGNVGVHGKGVTGSHMRKWVRGPVTEEYTFTAEWRTSWTYAIEISVGGGKNGGRIYTYVYHWQEGAPEITTQYALKTASDKREIPPDGKSAVDISATLYGYIPGDDASSTPLAGQIVTFEISEIEGIRPGSLSSATAATDGDGIARITYTAPGADELKTLEEFRRHGITIKARSEQHDVEDLAYITIRPDRGKAFIEPSMDGILGTAYGGSRGIVPPDGRFPALIRAVLEDENMEPLVNTEAKVAIMSENPIGMLRSPDGEEAVTLNLRTDGEGRIEAHYFYASEMMPEEPITETIQITSEQMTIPLEVEVSVGLNMVIDNVESAYEGRGTVSAGEVIPLRIRVKDIWNPDLDLSEIIKYWGLGDGTGDTRLFIDLEIDNISSVPDYVMDHFRQKFYPESPFDEQVEIISSERLEQMNLLWVPDYSLLPYRGYPRVRPIATGNHYYEARVSLVDHHGEVVFETDYPATKGFFNLHTDMPADAIYLYFVSNPLRPQTEEAEYLAIALDWLGAGCLISVVDALDAINRGDTDALFSIMFSEIRGFFVDQAKDMSPDFKKIMTHYSRLSFADRINDQIEQSIQLRTGDTKEKLFDLLEKEFADADGKLIMFTDPEEPGFPDVPVYENKLHYDNETGIASLKSANWFFFIVPEELSPEEY